MAAGPTLAPGAAFGLYALPSDDLAAGATSVISPGSPALEDPDYPADNLIAPTNTGHLNLPSRPAKLLDVSGSWELTFGAPITVGAMALIYHNLDEALDVTLEPSGGTPIAITIPPWTEDGWSVSPFQQFAQQTASVWTLSINGANSRNVEVGRLLLFASLRDMENDVRWGVEEVEEHGLIEQPTELGIETIYDIGGKRRSFSGELALMNTESGELITLYRTAHGRVLPWLLIPDEDINDAWLVRFDEPRWSRTRAQIEHNLFPFRVKELSRGLPWP